MRPTQSLQKSIRRLELSTKQAGREYYKGNAVGSMGTIDKFGRFHPDYSKIRTYVYPAKGTKGFELTPFVSSKLSKNVQTRLEKWETVPKPITGAEYLQRWKAEGGHDIVYQETVEERKTMPDVWEAPPKKSDKKFWQK